MNPELVYTAAQLSRERLNKTEQVEKLRELTKGMNIREKTRFYTLLYIELNRINREEEEQNVKSE